jgi:predicted RNA binding protein YcfA (HicA-like mRNA interferase family)
MPPLVPLKRRDLIRALRQLGFDGPFPGGNHQYMSKEQLKVTIPNPHRGDISKG